MGDGGGWRYSEMSAMNDYHDQAMEAAFLADLARKRDRDEATATELFAKALELELKAIGEFTEPIEPSYSIFHRSAGWLAMDCGRPEQAVQLAGKARAADPHPAIAGIRSQQEAEAAAD